MKKIFSALFGSALIFCAASCSSPKSDGETIGKEFRELNENYYSGLRNGYDVFIENFDSFKFKTREDALEEIEKMKEGFFNNYEKEFAKVDKKREELLQKYADDPQKSQEFYDAMESFTMGDNTEETGFYEAAQRLTDLANSLPARVPNSAKIAQDLAAKEIHGNPGGYFDETWSLKADKNNPKCEVKIIDERIDGNDYFANVILTDSHTTPTYNFNLDISYHLSNDGSEWILDYLKTNDVFLNCSNKYKDCIDSDMKLEYGWYSLYLHNNSTVNLLVGFKTKDSSNNWKKSHIFIPAGQTKCYNADKNGYEIDFVERY